VYKVNMVMILGSTTALFQTTDPKLHNWTLLDPNFFPKSGGGGGLFFPLPRNTLGGGNGNRWVGCKCSM
jgi:hypothetical protein